MENDKFTEVRSEQWDSERGRQLLAYKASQLIWLLLGVLEGLFALRVMLKLIGANPSSPIAALIYSITSLFLIPFTGLIANPSANGMVLEISTFMAMLIYALIGWGIARLAWLVLYRPSGPFVEVRQTRSKEEYSEHQETRK